jgi:hypothetical protein
LIMDRTMTFSEFKEKFVRYFILGIKPYSVDRIFGLLVIVAIMTIDIYWGILLFILYLFGGILAAKILNKINK